MATQVIAPPVPQLGAIGLLRWTGRTLAWTVILGAVSLLVAMVLVPKLFGAAPYTVLTGSMRPDYPPGTLLVVRPVPTDQLGIGTVITYQLRSGEPEVVTHRIVAVSQDAAGEPRYVTRGDANGSDDRHPVRPVQIRGAVWYSVPYAGYLNVLLSGRQHHLVVQTVAGGLLAYAGLMFAASFVARRRRPGGEDG